MKDWVDMGDKILVVKNLLSRPELAEIAKRRMDDEDILALIAHILALEQIMKKQRDD